MSALRILWADDQAAVSATLASLLSQLRAEVTHVSDGRAALQELKERSFDLLIADLQMPPEVWGGLWLLDQIKKEGIEVSTIVLSGQGTQVETIKAMRSGAKDYVTKERAESELLPRIRERLDQDSSSQQISALLAASENAKVEFKSSARWDLRENKKNLVMEQIILKTVASFLNSDGGTLLLGVSDDGTAIGLDHDYQTLHKKNADGYELFLTELLLNHYGKDLSPYVRISFHLFNAKQICRITVHAAPRPVWVKEGADEHLYIRSGNSTRRLTTKEAIDYSKTRWKP